MLSINQTGSITHSVVVLTHNQSKYIQKILDSLAEQSVLPYEVIIIDDNSTEKYDYKSDYPFRILYEKLIYPSEELDKRSEAREIGFRKTTGEIVTFFDGDCYPKFDYLETIQKILSKEKKAIVCGQKLDTPMFMENIDGMNFFTSYYKGNVALYYSVSFDAMYSANLSLRRDMVTNYLFDSSFRGWGFEDTEMVYRLQQQGAVLIRSHFLQVVHYWHEPRTISDKKRTAILLNALNFIKKWPNERVMDCIINAFMYFDMRNELYKVEVFTDKFKDTHKDIIEIELTLDCNLKCGRCNRLCDILPDSTENISLETIKKFVEESIMLRKRWTAIRFMGGEPSLYPQLEEALKLLKPYKDIFTETSVEIITNGKIEIPLYSCGYSYSVVNSKKEETYFEHDVFTASVKDYDCEPDNYMCHMRAYQGDGEDTSKFVCGISLGSHGYFLCGAMRAINRVFKVIPENQFIFSLSDFLNTYEYLKNESSEVKSLCDNCGHRFAIKKYLETKGISSEVSDTWNEKFGEYNETRNGHMVKKPFFDGIKNSEITETQSS